MPALERLAAVVTGGGPLVAAHPLRDDDQQGHQAEQLPRNPEQARTDPLVVEQARAPRAVEVRVPRAGDDAIAAEERNAQEPVERERDRHVQRTRAEAERVADRVDADDVRHEDDTDEHELRMQQRVDGVVPQRRFVESRRIQHDERAGEPEPRGHGMGEERDRAGSQFEMRETIRWNEESLGLRDSDLTRCGPS